MKNRILSLLAALALSALAQTAHAGLITDTVHVNYLFPDVDTVYDTLGSATVDAGGAAFTFYDYFNLTVSDRQVVVDFTFAGMDSWTATSFNGFVVTDLNKALPSFALNGATTMSGFSSSNFYVSGNALYVNWQGLAFDASTRVVLDAATDVPEPFTLSLMGLGLLGLGVAQRRRK